MSDFITIKEIADHLNVNTWTVYRWIDWYYSDLPKPDNLYLPDFKRKGVSKVYYRKDLHYFEEFQRNLPRGAMARYNYRFNRKYPIDDSLRIAIKHSADKQRAIKYKRGD